MGLLKEAESLNLCWKSDVTFDEAQLTIAWYFDSSIQSLIHVHVHSILCASLG